MLYNQSSHFMLIICLCDMHLCVNSLTVKTKYHIKAAEDASRVLFEYSNAFKKTAMKSFFYRHPFQKMSQSTAARHFTL